MLLPAWTLYVLLGAFLDVLIVLLIFTGFRIGVDKSESGSWTLVWRLNPYRILNWWNAQLWQKLQGSTTHFLDPAVDVAARSFHEDLVAHFDAVRTEVLRYREQYKGMPMSLIDHINQRWLQRDKAWRTIWLRLYGRNIDVMKDHLPVLWSVMNRHAEVPLVMISTLAPRSVIPVHTGPFKGVLRYHLALKVPRKSDGSAFSTQSLGIRVDDEVYTWSEGEAILFDDTFDHEVWNRTKQERVILFADIVRGDLSWWESWVNRLVQLLVMRSRHIREITRRAEKHSQGEEVKVADDEQPQPLDSDNEQSDTDVIESRSPSPSPTPSRLGLSIARSDDEGGDEGADDEDEEECDGNSGDEEDESERGNGRGSPEDEPHSRPHRRKPERRSQLVDLINKELASEDADVGLMERALAWIQVQKQQRQRDHVQ